MKSAPHLAAMKTSCPGEYFDMLRSAACVGVNLSLLGVDRRMNASEGREHRADCPDGEQPGTRLFARPRTGDAYDELQQDFWRLVEERGEDRPAGKAKLCTLHRWLMCRKQLSMAWAVGCRVLFIWVIAPLFGGMNVLLCLSLHVTSLSGVHPHTYHAMDVEHNCLPTRM